VLAGYRFEHPKTEATVEVGGWSYLWAGLLGGFYVWSKGCSRGFVLRAFAYNVFYAVGVVGVVAFTSYIPSLYQAFVLVAMVPTAILVQGGTMLRLIKDAYRKRGWMIRLR
jgi:hypothetical protein